jgi:hypothetical protein
MGNGDKWLGVGRFVLFCCLDCLIHNPGKGRAQLCLMCLSPKTHYLHHLLTLSQDPGCVSEGLGAKDATGAK